MRRVLAGTLAWTAAAAFGAPPPELEVGCASPECSDRTGAPFCTVGGALRTAPSGATILLREGVCRETVELGKSVTLRGRGADATVIDAARQGRVLRVHRDAVVVLSGVTLRHGSTEREDEKDGGGIWSSGDLTLEGVVVEDNLALDDGGGIRNDGRLRLVGSTVRNNRAPSWGGVGGGLYNVPIGGDGIAEVVDSRVVGNEAGFGRTSGNLGRTRRGNRPAPRALRRRRRRRGPRLCDRYRQPPRPQVHGDGRAAPHLGR